MHFKRYFNDMDAYVCSGGASPSAAKAVTENKTSIAAVNRCATQKPKPHRVFQHSVKPCPTKAGCTRRPGPPVISRFLTSGIFCFVLFVAIVAVIPCHVMAQASIAHPVAQPASAEIVLTLDPAQTQVHWTVDSALHTVHGTFTLKSGTVHFDPNTGVAGGEIVVSASSGQSGNGSRDKRMHKEIIESAKYPDVVFHPTHVEGKVSRSGSSDVTLSGTFSIHGADHDLSASVHAEFAGDHWTGTCKFPVPYVNWGIKDPSNFLLKVQPVVNVELDMSGGIAPTK
jgi:polyisoprenoid-binding protein YceI